MLPVSTANIFVGFVLFLSLLLFVLSFGVMFCNSMHYLINAFLMTGISAEPELGMAARPFVHKLMVCKSWLKPSLSLVVL